MISRPFIILTFLVALMLHIIPLPLWAIWLKPLWVVLVLIYWINKTPYQVGLFIAWMTGFCLDILNGTLLGEHALALTVVAFAAAKFQRRVRVNPLSSQLLHILFYLMLYQAVLFLIQEVIGQPIRDWRFWLAPFTSMLLWPWLAALLYKFHRHPHAI